MLGGISIWQLLIIFAIIIMIFGTKKLRNLGGDLGGAVKGFKKAMSEDSSATDDLPSEDALKDEAQKQLSQKQTTSQDADFDKVKDQDKS